VSHERSAWENAIIVPVPTTSVSSARAARRVGRYAAFVPADVQPDDPGEQVRRLESLISTDAVTVRSRAESKDAVIPSLVELIDSNTLDGGSLNRIMTAMAGNPDLLRTLAEMDSMGNLSDLVRGLRRKRGLEQLRRAVLESGTEMSDLRRLLRREWWVFGSHLVPWIREEIIPGLDEHSIPLIRFDGAIHVVIVEPSRVPDLVTGSVGSYRTSPLIAAACDRARQAIRALEAGRETISERLAIECGRAVATVVIGHPDFVDGVEPGPVRDELRVLNTFAAGIAVITYEELISVAEQTLGDAGDQFPSTDADS
jgi:hypothetical protein